MTVLVRVGAVSSRRFGFELVKPSSVVASGAGSSATISNLGSVEFSSCTSLSLNGVFQSGYDNYMILIQWTGTVGNSEFWVSFRASGSDNSTASSYVYQELQSSGTVVSGGRTTNTRGRITNTNSNLRCGTAVNVYGPFLAQPTAWRSVGVTTLDNAAVSDFAGTHNQSTSYDGFTLSPNTGNFSGRVAVYGMRG